MSVGEVLESLNQQMGTLKQRVEQIHDYVLAPKAVVTMSRKDKIEVAIYNAVATIVLLYLVRAVFHVH